MPSPFDNFPDIQFVETDPRAIEQGIISGFEAAAREAGHPVSLASGDPRRLFLLSLAAWNIQERVIQNHTARQELVKYAEAAALDNLLVYWGPPGKRLEAASAKTTLKFTLPAVMSSSVVVPAGTQVGASDKIAFATDEEAVIPAGQTSVTVSATAIEPGTEHNGYAPGKVTHIQNWDVSFAVAATNTTESGGGADRETDQAFRDRGYLLPMNVAVCGPADRYKLLAKTANPGIVDVAVWNKEEHTGNRDDAGTVMINPLMVGGKLPTQAVLEDVYAIVTRRDLKPIADKVIVEAPTVVNYTIDLTFFIDRADSISAESIRNSVTQAVNGFVDDTKIQLGVDINVTDLIARIRNAGALRVNVKSPKQTIVSVNEVAIPTNITVNYGGLVNP
jgi:phage-related baseplate assembly protein